MDIVFIIFPLICAFCLYHWFRDGTQSTVPLPPGPRPLPVIGNLRDLPSKQLWLKVAEWAKRYGDICHINVLGQNMIFVSSPEAISALLDARGSIYSDRPQSVMAGELCGCKRLVSLSSYNDSYKRRRRLMHRALAPRIIPSYHPWIKSSTRLFIRELIRDPEHYVGAIRRYAGGLTSSVIYGYEVKSAEDRLLLQSEEFVDIMSNEIATGGVFAVDMFPFLQYLPTWFPGTGFKRRAEEVKKKMDVLAEEPFKFVKMKIQQHIQQTPSFCSVLLDNPDGQHPMEEVDIEWAATTMFSASSDTTVAVVSMFLLAILKNPEVLRKAQREVDEVVGPNRLPGFEDRDKLPYIEAVMSEALRWGVPAPLNIPHVVMEEDIFRDMRIPKGSLVIANIWSIARNEELYPNPHAFDPDRFLSTSEKNGDKPLDPRNFVFGFGRRRCPGADLIESTVWLLLATIIAALDIAPANDSEGKPILPEVQFDNAFFRMALGLKFTVRTRSKQVFSML